MALVVILVEIEYEENLGYCARACANFGVDKLVLVNPIAKTDSGIAIARAMHGKHVLENAVFEKSLDDAKKHADWLVATSSQKGSTTNLHRTSMDPRTFAATVNAHRQNVALVLGREKSGLRNDEIAQCDALVTIKADHAYDSLNLSHALAILLYECFNAPNKKNRSTIDARHKEFLEKAFVELLQANHAISNPRGALSAFKSILTKSQPTPKEGNALLTVLQKTVHKQNRLVNKDRKRTR